MQSIQSIQPAITPNYALQKRKPAAGNISMTGHNPRISEVSDKEGNARKNIIKGAGALALAALIVAAISFAKTKKLPIDGGNGAFKLKDEIVKNAATRRSATKAGQKALDAQAAINRSLENYRDYPGLQSPNDRVGKFLRRYLAV